MIFLCAGIALLGIFNFVTILVRNKRVTRSKGYRRAVAFYRWIESSQPKPIGWIHFPTAGVILLIAVFWLFIGSKPSFSIFWFRQLLMYAVLEQSGLSLKHLTIALAGTSEVLLSLCELVVSTSSFSVNSCRLLIEHEYLCSRKVFAVALFPFILAFGAKWNIVGFIVGCSHEKLQVFHQWLSHLFCKSRLFTVRSSFRCPLDQVLFV